MNVKIQVIIESESYETPKELRSASASSMDMTRNPGGGSSSC